MSRRFRKKPVVTIKTEFGLPEELEHMDLRVGDRVYIASSGGGSLSVGDIVKVTEFRDGLYPEPESPDQAEKREPLEELRKAREALATAEAKVEALA